MFDAKNLLESLMRGAQGTAPAPGGAPGGGLGDLLGQLAGGGQGGSQGGLADILGRVMQSGGGQGGLGDILGKLQQQMAADGQTGKGGGLMDVLGQVLGEATSGVRDGAGQIDQSTGASDKLRELAQQVSGKSPEEIMAYVQDLVRNNQLGAGAALGGLGALVLGTRTGRSLATGAAKLGALALIGGLAYKAYQNYAQGKAPQAGAGSPVREAAPAGSGFEPQAIGNDTAKLYIRAMIAAAAADGRIDDAEKARITGGLGQVGLESEATAFLQAEMSNPTTADDLAAAVGSQEEAVQVYTAARIAIDADTAAESAFLAELAGALQLDPALVAHVDQTTRASA